MTTTPRLLLPYIAVNQSQKEVTHNDALNRLDALVALAVESLDLSAPPATPNEGEVWIVGPAASGAWAGQEGTLAQWLAGAWAFYPATDGMRAWLKDRAVEARFAAGAWVVGELRGDRLVLAGQQVVGAQQPAIADPAGGTTIDAEARTAIVALLAALRQHGLIAP